MIQPIHIPLQRSFLCSDCDNIGNVQCSCPACGSMAVHPIAQWLNRSPEFIDTDPRDPNIWADDVMAPERKKGRAA